MRDWWNHGVHDRCLRVAFRSDAIFHSVWVFYELGCGGADIHGMLQLIPFIFPGRMHSHFDSIDSMLPNYDYLRDVSTLLELAIWKSEIIKQFSPNKDVLTTEMKMKCRIHSLSMGMFIVHNVLLFLYLMKISATNVERIAWLCEALSARCARARESSTGGGISW